MLNEPTIHRLPRLDLPALELSSDVLPRGARQARRPSFVVQWTAARAHRRFRLRVMPPPVLEPALLAHAEK
jgi:hypothetical protein